MSVKRVTVRMYRNLLGDCFLLRIAESNGKTRHILIDCGLLQGLPNAGDRMRAIADDIAITCGGTLDLLVVTHEHWDHISGFAQAREVFFDPARIKIASLWMAWTEDPADTTAQALRERFEERKFAITAFARALDASNVIGVNADLIGRLDNFIGPSEVVPGNAAAPTGRLTGRRILEELKKTAGTTTYLEPGHVVDTPGDAPLRVAVLGPPRNPERLFKDSPSAGANKETYLQEDFLSQSLLGVDGDPEAPAELSLVSPFARRFASGLGLADVEKAAAAPAESDARWLHDHYLAKTDVGEGHPQAFRRIDTAWAQNAASLALKLDSDTNNTSLVLAFELPDKSFLLFAADAQVGNWLSWHDQDYPFDAPLKAEDILARTRLYKVGHHGSHNATLRGKGLEMMTHDALVAMVSTVEAEAHDQGTPPGWLMPNPSVRDALYARCQGRVIIGDRAWASDPEAAAHKPQAAFAKALDESSDLYVEFTVFG